MTKATYTLLQSQRDRSPSEPGVGRWAGMILVQLRAHTLIWKEEAEEIHWAWQETSEAYPSDTPPSTRSRLLIIFKQPPVRTKFSNKGVCGGHFYSNHHKPEAELLFDWFRQAPLLAQIPLPKDGTVGRGRSHRSPE